MWKRVYIPVDLRSSATFPFVYEDLAKVKRARARARARALAHPRIRGEPTYGDGGERDGGFETFGSRDFF